MDRTPPSEQLEILNRYAAGQMGTRDAIEAAGLDDYADLIIALSINDLDFPKPTPSSRRDAAVAEASAILQPRLRRGG